MNVNSVGCVCSSGDGVNTSQPLPLSGSMKHDVLDATRLYSGNESEFMEMTACVGGMMGDDAVFFVGRILGAWF